MDQSTHRAYLRGRDTITLPLLQRDFSLTYPEAKRALAAYIELGWAAPLVSGLDYPLNRQLLTPDTLSEESCRALAEALLSDEDALLGELCQREDVGLVTEKVSSDTLSRLIEKKLVHKFGDRCYLSVDRNSCRTVRVFYAEGEAEQHNRGKDDLYLRGVAHPILISLLKENDDGESLMYLSFIPKTWKRYIRDGLSRYRGLPGLYPRLDNCPTVSEKECMNQLIDAFLLASRLHSKSSYITAAERNETAIRDSTHCPAFLKRAALAAVHEIRHNLTMEKIHERREALLAASREEEDDDDDGVDWDSL